ncbi:hypothetical protein EDB81DRAFT_794777 [Dactylonectria macrodidyma]|uniref:WLM domain-containing protein n=1 Tax=Dactylonectria macrodidyma TaxID=307937 RepID=A0A9P9EX76_9HYPO|nr:hypothetical protein EDB81DRAFT_794777 [Dactylonectria macrodidyma]
MKMGTESSAARVYRVGVPPVPQPHLPYTIDVCWSFTRQFQDRQFPRLNDDLISEVTSVAFREETEVLNEQLRKQGNKQLLSCIDGLKTMGGTLLHELTHTHLGGDTRDLPEGECYSWKCVVAAKSVRNADSFAMLGIALELWSRNYMVNEDGTFEKFE